MNIYDELTKVCSVLSENANILSSDIVQVDANSLTSTIRIYLTETPSEDLSKAIVHELMLYNPNYHYQTVGNSIAILL